MKQLLLVTLCLLLFVGSATAKKVNLQWDPSPSQNVGHYKVYMVGPGEGFVLTPNQFAPEGMTPVATTDGATLTAEILDLTDESGYYFAVAAGQGDYDSPLSNVVLSVPIFRPPGTLGGSSTVDNIVIPTKPQ